MKVPEVALLWLADTLPCPLSATVTVYRVEPPLERRVQWAVRVRSSVTGVLKS